jgi:hypothetical protein
LLLDVRLTLTVLLAVCVGRFLLGSAFSNTSICFSVSLSKKRANVFSCANMFRSRCLSAKLIIDFIAQCVVNENRIGSGERGDVSVKLIDMLRARMRGIPSSTCQVSKSECQ